MKKNRFDRPELLKCVFTLQKKRIYVYAVCTNMIRTIYIYNQIRITIYFTLDHIVVKQRGSVVPRYIGLVKYFIYQFNLIYQLNNTNV